MALFSENSSRWLVADQAVMMAGAADAVRGAASPAPEMGYIVAHSDACAIVCQDSATLERLAPVLATTASGSGNGAPSNGSGPPLGNGRAAENGGSNGAEVRGVASRSHAGAASVDQPGGGFGGLHRSMPACSAHWLSVVHLNIRCLLTRHGLPVTQHRLGVPCPRVTL